MRRWGIAALLLTLAIAVWAVYRPNEIPLEQEHADATDKALPTPDVIQEDSTFVRSPKPTVTPFAAEIGTDSVRPKEWPVPPATLESKFISALLGLPGLDNVVVQSAECSPTECEVRVTASNSDRNYGPVFSVIVNDLAFPRNISFSVVVELAEKFSRDFDVLRIDTDLGPPPDPTAFFLPAEILQEVAESRSAIIDTNNPVELFDFETPDGEQMRILLEDICESDCSFGSQRMIYLDLAEGQACDEFLGVMQNRLVGTEAGGVVERTFCVPNTLIPE
jgi:hypothetical protein